MMARAKKMALVAGILIIVLFLPNCSAQTTVASVAPSSIGSSTPNPLNPGPLPSTSPSSVPSPTPSSGVTLDQEESTFVTLINNYRVSSGLPALQVSITLTEASQWLSSDMATHNYLDHTDSLGRDFVTRLEFFGYPSSASAMGENIAAGNSDAAATFLQWKNSPPHNANMLDANYLALGVGRAYDASSTYGWYWATDFAS